MKTFKTPKGTELPISDIKGKDYLMVCYRLVWFREEHPDWALKTECVDMNEKSCLFRAEIYNGPTLVSVGHKREDKAHFHDYEEKAETGAIGRALAHCGYGTQFAPDIHEGERIVDAPTEPKSLNKLLPPRIAESSEKKTIGETLVKNLKQAKGSHDHAWKPSKFQDRETGEDLDYCITCKITRPRTPAFDDNEELPF